MDAQQTSGTVHEINWSELAPWLMLVRVFRLSISLPVLLLASVGAAATPVGWQLGHLLFIGSTDSQQAVDSSDEDGMRTIRGTAYFQANAEVHRGWPDSVGTPQVFAERMTVGQLANPNTQSVLNMLAVYQRFVEPFRRLGDAGGSIRETAFYLFGGIWNVLVWSFLAGAITRIAVVQLGRDERVGLLEALAHARRQFGWYVMAPFFPLIGVALAALPLAGCGLLIWLLAGVGVLITGVVWPLILLAGSVMVILLLGGMFGWPLMWPTISSEPNSDAFEAFSRSFSYTFQRPLQYLFYALVVTVLGALSFILVSHFANALIQVSLWGISWGSGSEQLQQLSDPAASGVAVVGVALVELGEQIVQIVVAGFNYAFFFTSASAIYLLLRRSVDQTDIDEVFVVEDEDTFGVPGVDPHGGSEEATPGTEAGTSETASGKSDTGKSDTGKSDTGKSDTGKSDQGDTAAESAESQSDE